VGSGVTEPLLPYTGPGANPIRLYLNGERAAIADIVRDLQDAAAEAQRRINKLETRNGIGSVVERAQLAMVKRELHGVQRELWLMVNRRIRSVTGRIAEAALTAEKQVEQVLFRAIGQDVPDELLQAQREYARQTVQTYMARGENGISLSERVYNTQKLANGLVDRTINREILLGRNWQELAKKIRPMINPDVPGGVSYAAKRLARTELNNAFHRTQINLAAQNPWVEAQQWHLSRSHPKPDVCDALAKGHSKGKPEGTYGMGEVPDKAHPQCLCYLTSVVIPEEDFIDSLVRNTPADVARGYARAPRSA
jgi:hypothetical protein